MQVPDMLDALQELAPPQATATGDASAKLPSATEPLAAAFSLSAALLSRLREVQALVRSPHSSVELPRTHPAPARQFTRTAVHRDRAWHFCAVPQRATRGMVEFEYTTPKPPAPWHSCWGVHVAGVHQRHALR